MTGAPLFSWQCRLRRVCGGAHRPDRGNFMAFIICNVLCIAVLVGIDQAIKAWAVAVLAPVGSMPLIPHIVELRFVLNEGMAFSMLSGR